MRVLVLISLVYVVWLFSIQREVQAQIDFCNDPIQAPFGPSGSWNVYQGCLDPTTWDDAHEIAIESSFMGVGGHLVDVHSKTENDFVHSTGRLRSHVWIGLTDRVGVAEGASEGNFVWTSGKPLSYTNWSNGEPNNGQGGAEDIVHLRARDRDWNDQKSNYFGNEPVEDPGSTDESGGRTFNYVVEYPIESPTPLPDVRIAPRQPLVTKDLTVYYSFDEIVDGNLLLDGSGTNFHGLITLGTEDARNDGLEDIRLDFEDKKGGPASVRFATDPAINAGAVANPDYITVCDPENEPDHGFEEFSNGCGGPGSGARDRLRELPLNGMTIALWAKVEDSTADNSLYDTLSLEDASTSLQIDSSLAQLTLLGEESDGILSLPDLLTEQPVADNEWLHLAVTYQKDGDPNPGEWAFYLNGNEVKSGVADLDLAGTEGEILSSWSDGAFLGLSPDKTGQLAGWIDEFYLFRRGLTAEEISVLFRGDAQTLNTDFNGNGEIDAGDLDAHAQLVRDGDLTADLNGDGVTDFDDRLEWISSTQKSWLGDSNFDGEFNTGDLVFIFQAGKYETGEAAGYAEGDWNGDNQFSSGDLVVAFQAGGYELGPRPVAAVPECGSLTLLMIGGLGLLGFRRKTVNGDQR